MSWNNEERLILERMFPDNYTKNICEILGRSYSSVATKARVMGLKKSKTFIKIELERQANRLKNVGAKSRFKKGSVSANKGKKMPDTLKSQIAHTFFKKGNLPHNTRHDGAETIRVLNCKPYIWKRISLGVWKQKHRLVWEENIGPIPSGYNVQFKDNNTLNCEIENLYLISRKEQSQHNKNGGNKLPFELKQSVTIINKIKKKIKQCHETK
ncbi:MAG: HNH endonuclease [Bacteroidetes bacterium]|nr:HNH endonuclease [Bacteroidota bacterium]